MTKIIEFKKPEAKEEAPEVKPLHNYSGNAFEGARYRENRDLSLKEIAKLTRAYVKENYPDCKFSIRTKYFSMGCEMTISLMAAPFEVATGEYDSRKKETTPFDGYAQLNQHTLDRETPCNGTILTDKAREVLKSVYDFANSYNYSDTDAMTDYFDVGFYLHIHIGKWDKPFEVVKPKKKPVKSPDIQKTEESPDQCIIGEYKGHPTIKLPTGFTFGLKKAKAILDHIEDIKRFVESKGGA